MKDKEFKERLDLNYLLRYKMIPNDLIFELELDSLYKQYKIKQTGNTETSAQVKYFKSNTYYENNYLEKMDLIDDLLATKCSINKGSEWLKKKDQLNSIFKKIEMVNKIIESRDLRYEDSTQILGSPFYNYRFREKLQFTQLKTCNFSKQMSGNRKKLKEFTPNFVIFPREVGGSHGFFLPKEILKFFKWDIKTNRPQRFFIGLNNGSIDQLFFLPQYKNKNPHFNYSQIFTEIEDQNESPTIFIDSLSILKETSLIKRAEEALFLSIPDKILFEPYDYENEILNSNNVVTPPFVLYFDFYGQLCFQRVCPYLVLDGKNTTEYNYIPSFLLNKRFQNYKQTKYDELFRMNRLKDFESDFHYKEISDFINELKEDIDFHYYRIDPEKFK